MAGLAKPIILSIDTSCDETSAAITSEDRIISNVVSSQVKLHQVWGGIVPDIARRAHQERIDKVIEKCFLNANSKIGGRISWEKIDAIAVTYGPGLAIALEVGISKAKELAKKHNKPLIAVNHLEGHLLSATAKNSKGRNGTSLKAYDFPLLSLIISGKHTELVVAKKIGKYKVVGETLDDAIGEAYDKVGRMLGLGYPAGPIVTEFAKMGDPNKYPLPVPMQNKGQNLNFSFSGLKTAVYYLLKKDIKKLSKQDIYDISASFESSAIKHLQQNLSTAIIKYKPKILLVGGGVGSSSTVRRGIRNTARNFELEAYFPYSKKLYIDNAGMIGVAAYHKYLQNKFVKRPSRLERMPRLSLDNNLK